MSNQAAWLDGIGKSLRIGEAPMPEPKDDEILIRIRATAINPVDNDQVRDGWEVKTWPYVLGQDVAGDITTVGSEVKDFNIGDRVIAHLWAITTGDTSEGGFALYAKVLARNAAHLPDDVDYKDGAVLPVALDTAISGLYAPQGFLNLPLPSFGPKPNAGVLLIYGGSSSVGLSTTQLAVASGMRVIATASPRNHAISKSVGAHTTLDYRDPDLVEKVIRAVGDDEFVGIYDAISVESTYAHDLAILKHFGGGKLVTVLDPPENLPDNVQVQFVFGQGKDLLHVWDSYIKEAVSTKKLKFLPEPLVVGKGLESFQKGLERLAEGVSAQKVVVEL